MKPNTEETIHYVWYWSLLFFQTNCVNSCWGTSMCILNWFEIRIFFLTVCRTKRERALNNFSSLSPWCCHCYLWTTSANNYIIGATHELFSSFFLEDNNFIIIITVGLMTPVYCFQAVRSVAAAAVVVLINSIDQIICICSPLSLPRQLFRRRWRSSNIHNRWWASHHRHHHHQSMAC